MCGICGRYNFGRDNPVSLPTLKAMADSISHRGPDDEGYFTSGALGLGFRRLSIIDLATGHQPVFNEDQNVCVVFNGEIYNYEELTQQLQSRGHRFRTRTDTEVIVHLYEEFGVGCLEKLRGMFAFALWDQTTKTLLLARDRVGIKPLYYRLGHDSLSFASEIKALLADPDFDIELNPNIVDRFLGLYYLPGEDTLLKSIYKIPAGSWLLARNGKIEIRSYWDLHFSPSPRSLAQAQEELLGLMDEAVRMHMISDVPVGFLLSGGVDSTAMLNCSVGKSKFPLSSYTLGFNAAGITDERPYARLAADTYGSEHHEMTISANHFLDFLPDYVWHMEEPVCEPPALALYFVSRLAKDHVKVLISGEGGDEAFAGYQNYRTILWVERLKSMLGPLSQPLSSALAAINRPLGSARLGRIAPLFGEPFESYYLSRLSTPFRPFNSRFRELYSHDFANHVDKAASIEPVTRWFRTGAADGLLNRMLYVDTKTWLVDDLLLKADKMTMANSIELRVPLLDHKVLEFAASLPENLKVRGFTTKYIAKKALASRVPRPILNRKKTGFPVPYASWLRNDLRSWLEDILLDRETMSRGYFNPDAIRKLIADDRRTGSYPKELFSLAVLELWHRNFLGRAVGERAAAPALVH